MHHQTNCMYVIDFVAQQLIVQDMVDLSTHPPRFIWVSKTWRVIEFYDFIFKGWKVMEFKNQPKKVMKNKKYKKISQRNKD